MTTPSYQVDGLELGQHLWASVVAFAGSATTPQLSGEVASAEVLDVPEGDVSVDFCGANAFLERGTVDIPCERLAVVVGHVRAAQGSGVPGLSVSILGHPEFGKATSQADGQYALAVPAGQWTVDIRAASFLPVQRWVTAKARDFTSAPDVVVLRRDEKATVLQVAQGGFHRASTVSDKDGTRASSVYVPPGTGAWLRMADGGTIASPTLTLRATEATVGNQGPAAMPASLPAASAYTFAVDVSADEALAVGALGVGFDRDVAVYSDNFLGFPVGTAIPTVPATATGARRR